MIIHTTYRGNLEGSCVISTICCGYFIYLFLQMALCSPLPLGSFSPYTRARVWRGQDGDPGSHAARELKVRQRGTWTVPRSKRQGTPLLEIFAILARGVLRPGCCRARLGPVAIAKKRRTPECGNTRGF